MLSTSPKLAASRNGVEPAVAGVRPLSWVMRRETSGSDFSRRTSGSAPASSSARTTSGICRWTAACSGVRPAPSWFGSAPRASRKCAIPAWPLSMATSRADASVSSLNSARAFVSPPMPSGAASRTSAPRGQQQPGHVQIALLRGEQQRREAVRRAHGRAAPCLQQDARHLGLVLGYRPHQRGLAAGLLGRRRVGPGPHQAADDLDPADPRRGHQRGHAAGPRGVRVGSGLEQQVDHRDARVEAGERQRRHAVIVGRVDVGAGGDEPSRQVRQVTVGGPVERRRPVSLRLVDVGAGGQQPLDAGRVRHPDRVDQGQVDGGRRRRRAEQSDGHEGNDHRQDPHGWTSPSA